MTAPTARRLRPPSWRDPRLLIGLILVLGSVGTGVQVLAAADRTAPVYVARATLPAGTALSAAQLSIARLRLTGGSARYLDAAHPVPAGFVLQRTIGAGELVPVAALAPAGVLGARPVTVPLDEGLPAGLVVGGTVDVWSTPDSRALSRTASAGTTFGSPRRIVAGVEVYHVATGDRGGLGVGQAAAVQVLVPESELTLVLAALASDNRISLLPVPGGAA